MLQRDHRGRTLLLPIVGSLLCSVFAAGCGLLEEDNPPPPPGGVGNEPRAVEGWATEVIAFEPGEDAGFGQGNFPAVVLGPPGGGGTYAGSLNVLSLGVGGSITLGFGPDGCIVNGDGDDFTVAENVFYVGGDENNRFIETARVAVSQDLVTFVEFPTFVDESLICTPENPSQCGNPDRYSGFAGVEAVLPGEHPAEVGGDRFDLDAVGLAWARYVRITDTAGDPWDAGDAFGGGYGKAGFDLDAVGAIHFGRGSDCAP